MASDPDRVTLHSSWRGIIGVYLGGAIVLAIGIFAVVAGGWRTFSAILLGIGVVIAIGVAGDFPIASTFTADGVHRHTLLRRQFIPWDKVKQLSRARVGVVAGIRHQALGGLVAAVGRRRYLLVDQGESAREFDRVLEVVGDREEALALDVLRRPTEKAAPTWLYRTARWTPEEARRR